jgi:hypothetical protein
VTSAEVSGAQGICRGLALAQPCALTLRREAYATAPALESSRNWRFGKAGLWS